MNPEEQEREVLTAKQEKAHKAELAALLLLLLSRKAKRSEYKIQLTSQILSIRKSTAKATAEYLNFPTIPGVSTKAIPKIVSNMITRVGSTIDNSPIKLTPKAIVKIIEPSIDRIVTSEVFTTHNNVYVDVIKQTKESGYFLHSAVMDKATCPICTALHGTRYPLSSRPNPVQHARCRCIVIFVST